MELRTLCVPYPANKKVYIDFDSKIFDEANLSIYDLAGKTVYANTIEANQERLILNVEHLSNGIYLISITDVSMGEMYIERLTISH